MAIQTYPKHGADFLHDASSEININYIKMCLNFLIKTHFIYAKPFSIIPLVLNEMSFIGLRKCF